MLQGILRIVRATNGLHRKRQELLAEIIRYMFKSGGYTNIENKIKMKQEFVKELLNPEALRAEFGGNSSAAEMLLANQAACQVLWGNLQMAIHVFESIYDYVESHHLLDTFLEFIEVFFEKLGFSFLLFLSSSGLNNVGTPEQQRLQEMQAEQALSIMKNFAEMIQVFLKSCRCIKGTNTQIMMKLMGVMSILDKLYGMRMGNLSKSEHNIIFEPTSKPQINNILAKFKMFVLDSVKELLEFFNHEGRYVLKKKKDEVEMKIKNQKKMQVFILHLNSIIRLSVNSLVFYFSDPQTSIGNIYSDIDLQSLIVESIRIITMGSYNCEIFNSLIEKKTQLLHLVFLPSFVQTPDLLETMTENPDDFIQRNFYFFAQRKKDYNLRMIGLQSMKILCSQLDGYLSQVVSLAMNSIRVLLSHQTPEQIENEHDRTHFADLMRTSFWGQVNMRMKVDSCLLILSELSYLIRYRSDLVLKLEAFVRQVIQQLTIQCQDDLILTRMILFCGKYLDILFQNDAQMQLDIVKWVMSNLPFTDTKGSAAEMVIFSMMINDNEKKRTGIEKDRIFTENPQVSSLAIEKLMHRISMEFRPNLIEAFLALVKLNSGYFMQNPESFKQYFQKLVSIVVQIAQQAEDSQKSMISNIWYLIKQVCEIKELFLQYREFIEKHISDLFPLVDQMEGPNNFDEDLIQCIIAWNSHTNDVSQYALGFIRYMEKVQTKNQGALGSLYNLLNNFFIFAKDKFTLKDVQMVMGMALKSIAAQDSQKTQKSFMTNIYGLGSAQGFLMIQMIMANMTHFIPDPTLESIIGIFKQFYAKNLPRILSMYDEVDCFDDNYEDDVLENSEPMMYFDKMMGIFLMGAYLFPGKVLKHFLQFEFADQVPQEHHLFKFTYIIDLICSRFDEFMSEYDKKLWMLSFSRMIEFFLKSFLESGRKEHLDLLRNLVYKSVLILKGYQLNIRISAEHWNVQKHSRYLDVFMESCDEFNSIREFLNISRNAQSLFGNNSQCYDIDDDEDDMSDYDFVEIEKKKIMKGVQSPLLKLDEIQEFRRVMVEVRKCEPAFKHVKQSMPAIVQKYFTKVAFEFERVGRRIRNIRKLKPRMKA